MVCSLSNLTDQELSAIQQLENNINKPLLAFSCHALKMADLSPEDLKSIQELENRLGISLVAVDAA